MFLDLLLVNLGGGGGIDSSLCHHLCLSERSSTLSGLMLAGCCMVPCSIDAMPLTLNPKCYDDQLGFS